MSTKKTSPVVALAGLGILAMALFYGAQGMQRVEGLIAALPIQGKAAPRAEESVQAAIVQGADKARSMHPLLIESSRKAAAVKAGAPEVSDTSQYDALFGRTDLVLEKKRDPVAEAKLILPPTPPPIDYFAFLRNSVTLAAVTTKGAVINGKYYLIGESIVELAYPKRGTTHLQNPVLQAVQGETVVIAEADSSRHFQVKLSK